MERSKTRMQSSAIVPVVTPQFTSPNPMELVITRNVLTATEGNFTITNVNGRVLFKVKGVLFSLRSQHVLVDATGFPIVTLRRKILSAHRRWQVFRGRSTDAKDLLFSAKRSSLFQLKTTLDVFLANNQSEFFSDFKVKGSWTERSCVVYAGETSTIVAQMRKNYTAQSVLLGKDKFVVTVNPNVDYVFIIALIVILDAIDS